MQYTTLARSLITATLALGVAAGGCLSTVPVLTASAQTQAPLLVSPIDGPTTISPGDRPVYHFTLQNSSRQTAHGIRAGMAGEGMPLAFASYGIEGDAHGFRCDTPWADSGAATSGPISRTCTDGTLAPGESVTLRLEVEPLGGAAGGSGRLTASASCVPDDPAVSGQSNQTTLTIQAR